jgi:hypothetical protein
LNVSLAARFGNDVRRRDSSTKRGGQITFALDYER